MKVFVTGVAGQLGHDVVNALISRGLTAIGSDLAPSYAGVPDDSPVTRAPYYSLDITDAQAVARVFAKEQPDALIHCAAWTAVDAAQDEDKQETVRRINAQGTAHLAKACRDLGCKMMYISTDYVFDGQGTLPWEPDCKAYAPLNVYGQTKLEGELAVTAALTKFFIVRIAWVFGKSGNNYIRTMLRLGKNHDALRIVNDQIGTPTYTCDLARLLVDMITTDRYGFYHATNQELPGPEGGQTRDGCATGYISWYDFSKEIFRQAAALGYACYDEKHLSLTPVTTAEYGLSKAKRPFNSRLSKEKLMTAGFTPLPDWQDALQRYLTELDIDAL